MGDYLVVGIHDDCTVRAVKGPNYPVMSLIERTLNVLGVRDVDEVIVAAPWHVTEYLIESFNINLVVRGARVDSDGFPPTEASNDSEDDVSIGDRTAADPYSVPKRLGIYREIESESYCTTGEILRRIRDNKTSLTNSLLKRKVVCRDTPSSQPAFVEP